jgi:hypothetical protein
VLLMLCMLCIDYNETNRKNGKREKLFRWNDQAA